MMGAIVGDIIGSPYELAINNCYSRDKIQPFKNTHFGICQFTDDSILTLAIGRVVLENSNVTDLGVIKKSASDYMKKYYKKYPNNFLNSKAIQYTSEKFDIRFEDGFFKAISCYGGRFIEWAKSDKLESSKRSNKNGGAMRVSPVGWMYGDLDTTIKVARTVTQITHSGDAVIAAETLAALIFLARRNKDKNILLQYARQKGYDVSTNESRLYLLREKNRKRFRKVIKNAKNPIKKAEALVLVSSNSKETLEDALYAFFTTDTFKECVITAVSIGGDSDTIACMAGALAEAYYGEVPKEWRKKAYQILENKGCSKNDIERIKHFKDACYQL